MNIQNWKTTAWGVGGAIVYLALVWFANHAIGLTDIAVAGALIGIGANAADATTAIKTVAGEATHLAVMKNGVVKSIVPIADSVADGLAASHPLNPVLTDIKTGLDTLNSTLAAQAPATPAKA